MICLAMDTAGTACSACIYDAGQGEVMSCVSVDLGRGHAEHLMETVATALSKAHIGYGELDRIVTTVGPGNFTGVRISVATAKGFGLGLDIPVVGISNLAGMLNFLQQHAGIADDAPCGVLVDAKRSEVYGMLSFESPLSARGEAFLASQDEIEAVLRQVAVDRRGKPPIVIGLVETLAPDITFPGSGVETLHLPPVPIEVFARLGAAANPGKNPPDPLYLRRPDAAPQVGFAVERLS